MGTFESRVAGFPHQTTAPTDNQTSPMQITGSEMKD